MKLTKKNFQLAIISLLVLLILPVAYYFLYALPSFNTAKLELEKQKYEDEQRAILEREEAERQKYEDEQRAILEKEEREELEREAKKIEVTTRQYNLDLCIAETSVQYGNLWKTNCEAWKIEVDTAWSNCRANKIEIYKDVPVDWYGKTIQMKQFAKETDAENRQRCVTSTPDYVEDENNSCLLSQDRINTIETRIKESKDECYRRYTVSD